jgi:amino acid transporter
MMPLEGGLYQWAKAGYGEMAGFLTAWNLWIYAVTPRGFPPASPPPWFSPAR